MITLTSSNNIPATEIDVKNTNGTGSKPGVLDGKILSQVSADSLPKVDTACVPTVNAEPTTFTPKLDEHQHKIDDSDEDSGPKINLTERTAPLEIKYSERLQSLKAVIAQAGSQSMAGPGFNLHDGVPRLISAETLEQNVGHMPKDDWRIGRIPVRNMSTNYKAVLKGLNAYEGMLKDKVGTGKDGAREHAAKLVETLGEIHRDAEKYIKQHEGTPSKATAVDAMKTLQSQVMHEIALVNRVATHLVDGEQVRNTMHDMTWKGSLDGAGYRVLDSVARYNDGNLQGKPVVHGSGALNTVIKLTYGKLGGETEALIFKADQQQVQDVEAIELVRSWGIDPDRPAFAARNVAMAFVNETLGLKNLVHCSFAMHDKKIGIVMDEAPGRTAHYQTKVAVSTDQHRASLDGFLGEMNLDLDGFPPPENETPEQKRDRIEAFVNAKEKVYRIYWNYKDFRPGEATGEQLRDAKNWQVGLPTNAVTDLLKDENVDGPKHANVQRELSNLEWLDGLCGQIDRHAGNYLIDAALDGSITVTGIDNDLSFGSIIKQLPAKDSAGKLSKKAISDLPKLIDSNLQRRIVALDFDRDLKSTLLTLLKPEEVAATGDRFKQLQKHAKDLDTAADGRVVSDWQKDKIKIGGQKVTVHDYLVNQTKDDTSSYYFREIIHPPHI